MKKGLIIVIILLVIMVGYVFYSNTQQQDLEQANQTNKIAYVTIDINPSVQLAVDENDEVVEAITLNEDADIALADIHLVGETLDSATEIIIDSAIELGYITEINDTNAVNVTTYSEDELRREDLNRKLESKINARLENRKVYALIVENGLDEELKIKADSYGIAYGKMLLIERAIRLDDSLVEEDLINLSIKEIQEKIKAQSIIRREEFINSLKAEQRELREVKTQRIAEAKVRLEREKDELLQNNANLTSEERQTLIEERKNQIKEEIKNVREELKQDQVNRRDNIKQEVKDKYLKNRR